MNVAATHLVLIPAYNPGRLLAATVQAARAAWPVVWVVVDGSTDGSHDDLRRAPPAGVRVWVQAQNGGKGSAVLAGARAALAAGFTHALVMDADGQHPADRIPAFMAAAVAEPGAVVCGRPVFGPEAPKVRLYGRQLSVGLVHLETAGRGAADPLFGFRVYPLAPLVGVLEATTGARHYDFDPEVAVRLAWAGVPAVNLEAACVYVDREQGGVSHFRYMRDNLRMIAMHIRLIWSRLFGRRPLVTFPIILLLLALAGPGRADEPVILTPALADGAWHALLQDLGSKGGVQANFTERRYFPFRTLPTVLHGIMRISPERGLSLQYAGDEASVLIADPTGLIIRDAAGHNREVAASSHQGGAIAMMLPILRFDLPVLFSRFDIRAQRTGADWRLEFTPKDPEVAKTLGLITVVGTGGDVRHLQFRHSASQRVDIDVEDLHTGLTFSPADLRAYFR